MKELGTGELLDYDYESDEMGKRIALKASVVQLREMLKSQFFDICVVRKVLENTDREYLTSSREYETLRKLHCIHFAHMDTEMLQYISETMSALLGVELVEFTMKGNLVKPTSIVELDTWFMRMRKSFSNALTFKP